ncbi:unnamed protein product [Linum tenue]|uniref:Uncharacterized protein n=1 Tax=Linum tenue TaxID=586396 RepID=A0AAV0Q664_9ROSI|nr:unnamed protein product [Linum tenue]
MEEQQPTPTPPRRSSCPIHCPILDEIRRCNNKPKSNLLSPVSDSISLSS